MMPPETSRILPPDDATPAFPENLPELPTPPDDEAFRRAIPAQVFLNHFYALRLHLDEGGTPPPARLSTFRPRLQPGGEATVKRLLRNAWSTEYALRNPACPTDADPGAANTLYWTFPQAFYSVAFSLRAFLAALGLTDSDEPTLRRHTGRLVERGYYPPALGFYADGDYSQPSLHGLPYGRHAPGSLNPASATRDAQAQLGQALRATRKLQFTHLRQQTQANPGTALRHAKTGNILTRFGVADWRKLTPLLGPTTFYDLLSRLRISDNFREVERYVDAEIDFRLFHESLLRIVGAVNGVHEAYVARALGPRAYEEFLGSLRPYLRQVTDGRRVSL
jgi:hypothetical protein